MINKGLSVCRLGYTSAVAYKFPTSGHVCVFSGSSLNKKRNAKEQKIDNTSPPVVQNDIDNTSLSKSKSKCPDGIFWHAKVSAKGVSKYYEQKSAIIGKVQREYIIGRSAKQIIKQRGAAMYRAGECKTIVTLSFISYVDDKTAIRCLQNFIRSLKKDYGNDINYLWVAERQKNGNPHFHLLTSEFYDIERENNRWVRVQYNAGLIYDYDGRVLNKADIENIISDGSLKDILNPFDVKRINNVQGVVSYLTKYMTKNIKQKDEKGRDMAVFSFHPWRCSHRVSRSFLGVLAQKETMDEMLSEKNVRVQKEDYKVDGGVKYGRGYVHKPVPFYGLWATKVNVYNEYLAGGQYNCLDEINKRVLIKGERPEIEYVSEYDYYALYCRVPTVEIIDLANEGAYENKFKNKRDVLFYDHFGVMRCGSFEGKVHAFGSYHLKNGKWYEVSPWTKDELLTLKNKNYETKG